MKSLSRFLLALLALCIPALPVFAAMTDEGKDLCPVVPRPLQYKQTGGTPFHLTAKTTIVADEALRPQAEWLSEALAAPTGWDLKVRTGTKGQIVLTIDTLAAPKPESYQLRVDRKGVTVKAHDAAGAFYALQTCCNPCPPRSTATSAAPTTSGRFPPLRPPMRRQIPGADLCSTPRAIITTRLSSRSASI